MSVILQKNALLLRGLTVKMEAKITPNLYFIRSLAEEDTTQKELFSTRIVVLWWFFMTIAVGFINFMVMCTCIG